MPILTERLNRRRKRLLEGYEKLTVAERQVVLEEFWDNIVREIEHDEIPSRNWKPPEEG